ncbi:MAG TPA: ATP-binding protein [Myxococcales bacterium]
MVVCASTAWNILAVEEHVSRLATAAARSAFEKDLAYRRWNAGQGGVYVPTTEATPPNPSLAQLPDRDLTTTDGRKLTLVNPAYMTRQVHELSRQTYGLMGHITSSRPLRPENAPDSWEATALSRLESGAPEVVEVSQVSGAPYLRLLGRLDTEERCLKCHAAQGYRVGQLRGGLSVSVPMAPYLAFARELKVNLALWHLLLWALGSAALAVGMVWFERGVRRREDAESALRAALSERAALAEQMTATRRLEALGRLAGGVAHDFNNLLVPILGNAELIVRDAPPGPLREEAEDIRFAAERASTTVRQLLAVGRNARLSSEPLDLGALLVQLRPLLASLVGEAVAVAVAVETEPPLPAVKADRAQLEMALINLAANARDAMPSGGSLRLSAREVLLDEAEARREELPPGRYVGLEVGDTGTGMTPETQRHLFEPFFTTKELGKGTGLGLAAVLGVVRQHGGAVSLRESSAKGTTFRILLPPLPAGAGRTGAGVAVPDPGATQRGRGTGAVLVAEDDAGVRRLLCATLGSLGYEVLLAADGAEALRVAEERAGALRLLVADLVMPGMSGPEVYQRLRERWPAVPVLFMSGHHRDALTGPNAVPARAAFLAKPFTAAQLCQAIELALDPNRG